MNYPALTGIILWYTIQYMLRFIYKNANYLLKNVLEYCFNTKNTKPVKKTGGIFDHKLKTMFSY